MNRHRTVAANVAALVKHRYVFPDVAARVSALLVARSDSGRYDITDADEFAARLTDDLRTESSDLHLRVRYSAEAHIPDPLCDAVREQNDRAEHCRQMAYGIGSIYRTDNDVAVLVIKELVEPQLSRAAYVAALASVADAAALMIDLRECVGGDPCTVALVCSHLFDARTQLSSIFPRAGPAEHFWAEPSGCGKRFGGVKPIFVLVANFTFSGAEMLAYDLQSAGRATVVGEMTGGGANPCAFHWPTPHFSVLLPEASSVSPVTGTNWEGCGVAPEVPCTAGDALAIAITIADRRRRDLQTSNHV